MGTLLSYSGLTTKIRAMESRLLKEPQYREISELLTVPQVVAYLKQQPGYQKLWSEVDEEKLHRNEVEHLLRRTIYQDFARIYHFANPEQRKFLDLYFKRYEIVAIKQCMNNIFDHRDVVLDLSLFVEFFERHSKLNLEKLTGSSSMEEFIENLKGSEYYAVLSRLKDSMVHPLVFDYGMVLDQRYFTQIWKAKQKLFKGVDLEEVTMAYGQKFDMLNLNWIYRSKKYYRMSPHQIYPLLIPVRYKLKRDEVKRMVEAESDEELKTLLYQSYYAKIRSEMSPESLEEAYVYILRSILEKEARSHPHSVAVMYSYLYHKEHEINRLTTAVECVRYGIRPEETIQYVMKN
ncbi:V0D/AC39 family V-type ATPase subunit [Hominifimenecus sp. rT4P-3]|uniref:V0D/AC39 family V-type ATPase subunit n=1 Tax=Hominifimenecus sp. rT4P-3 TaxID=3242979 RepID=UPI003DA20B7C